MAKQRALEKLDEQLLCALCLGPYADPKTLRCHHVYCRNCLHKLSAFEEEVICPACKEVTPIPEGVSGLRSALHVYHLTEIKHLLDVVEESESKDKEGSKDSEEEITTLNCSEHPDQKLETFCVTCQKVICLACTFKGGKHHGHDNTTLKSAFELYKGEITTSLEPIEAQLTTINSVLERLDADCGKVFNKQATIEKDIDDAFKGLHEVLDVRKKELLAELHQMTHDKLNDLTSQKEKMKAAQAQLSTYLDFLKKSLTDGKQEEVLMKKNILVKLAKELSVTYGEPEKFSIPPIKKGDMLYLTPDVSTLCQNCGKVTLVPEPSRYCIKNKTKVARVGEKTTDVLQIVDSYRGKTSEAPVTSIVCELISEINGTTVNGTIERRGENQNEISYQPTIKGMHQLHIKVDGRHIRESPFTVAVVAPIEKLGVPIQIVQIERPAGVAIHQNGKIITTSAAKGLVSIFNSSGQCSQSFRTPGSGKRKFGFPSGVVVDDEGNILVTDQKNQHIQKFTADGQFLKAVGVEGSGPLEFRQPWGITFNASNKKMYVTDLENHRIQVLNSDLSFCSSFGEHGSGRGQFNGPCSITCDSNGSVYVADFDNHRIQIFTAKGKFLRMFGKEGVGSGELSNPAGVAVDTNNRVYVVEWGNDRVSVFTSEGGFLTLFGKKGNKPGEFTHPRGLAVDRSEVVYVCDAPNNRIQMF